MAEVVDSIIADLIVRGIDQYEASFDRAAAAHGRFGKTVDALSRQTFDLAAEGQKYKAGADKIGQAEQGLTATVKRTRKERADAAVAADKTEASSAKATADAVKAAEKAKADAAKAAAKEIAAAQRQAQRDQSRYYAQGPRIFEAKASVFASEDRLKDAQAAKAAADIQRAAAIEQAEAAKIEAAALKEAAAAERAYYAQGPRIFEAKARQYAQVAREQAKAAPASASRGGVTVASDLFSDSTGVRPGTGANIGVAVPGRAEAERATEQARQVRVEAEAVAVAETEVNHALVEEARLRAGSLAATKEERTEIRGMLADMRTYNQLIRAGLSEEAAAVELDGIRAARAKALAEQQEKANRSRVGKDAQRFVEGAGLGRSFGSTATVAGVVAAGAAGATIAAVSSSIDYAKEIKNTADAVGLTTKQVQVYEAAARQAGVSTDQFRSGIGQLNSYLGRAKEGDEQAAKTFAALGVNIKNAAGAGDILPTLIDRLSKIPDAAQRAAIETRLFGEEGRRLDAVLSGGNEKVNELAQSLEATGAVLSSSDIAKLDDTAKKLAEVKAQLQVDLAQIVAGNADAIKSFAASLAALAGTIPAALNGLAKLGDRLAEIHGIGRVAVGIATGQDDYVKGGAAEVAGAQADINHRNANARADALDRGINAGLAGVDDAFSKVQKGKSDPNAIAKLFAPKAPKGKSADTLAAEAEQRTKQFNDKLAGFQEQQLRSEEAATGDIGHRAAIEQELADKALARAKQDIDSQAGINIHHGANAELEHARAAILKSAAENAASQERDNRATQLSADLADQQNQHLQTRLQIEAELLDGAQATARTSAERLAIQLRLLDIEKQQERAALQNQIDTAKPGTDLTDVKANLASLDQRYAGRATAAREQNLSPGQQYRRGLEVNSDTIQSEQIRLLDQFNKGLDNSIAKSLHLHGIFGDIVKDLIDMAIKQAVIKPIADGLFGSDGSGKGGGLGSVIKGVGSLFHFATGGVGTIQGNGGVDQNTLSINGNPVARVSAGERLAIVPSNIGSANGRVAPSASITQVHQTINVDGRNSVTPDDFAQQIIAVSADHANRVARQAASGAVQAAPARVQQKQMLGS